MSVKDHMHRLMSEIGPLLELAAVIESDDGDGWILAIEEDDSVLVELDEAEGRIFLSAEVGLPDDEARPGLYETLLVYNAQWHASGGVRMALDAPGGEVMQILELPAAGPLPLYTRRSKKSTATQSQGASSGFCLVACLLRLTCSHLCATRSRPLARR